MVQRVSYCRVHSKVAILFIATSYNLAFFYILAFLRLRLLATLCERAKNNTGIAIYKGNNNGNDKENVLVLSLSHCALIVIPLLSTTECDGSFVAVLSSFQLADKDAAKWTFTG